MSKRAEKTQHVDAGRVVDPIAIRATTVEAYGHIVYQKPVGLIRSVNLILNM